MYYSSAPLGTYLSVFLTQLDTRLTQWLPHLLLLYTRYLQPYTMACLAHTGTTGSCDSSQNHRIHLVRSFHTQKKTANTRHTHNYTC